MPSADRAHRLRLLALSAAWALSACAVPLDDTGGADAAAPDDPPTLASCAALASPPAIVGVRGRVRALSRPDGATLVVVGELQGPEGPIVDEVAYPVTATPAAASCAQTLAPADPSGLEGVDVSALGADLSGSLLAAFTADDGVYAFVRAFRGRDAVGTGLARWEADRGRFVAGPRYLFTPDRPGYGEAAVVIDGFVYAYGCAESGFLTDACFAVRAPVNAAADPTAWAYYRDGDAFDADPDQAWPLFSGGRGLAARTLEDGRVAVVYATPLGDTLYLRTGLGPSGPWSAPMTVTRCQLPADAFCGALGFVPPLDQGDDLALTYAIGTFDRLDPADLLTRLVFIPTP